MAHVSAYVSQEVGSRRLRAILTTALLSYCIIVATEAFSAGNYKIIYDFDGKKSRSPRDGVVQNKDGDFVGVVRGSSNATNLFKVTPSGVLRILAKTAGDPGGGVSLDKDGAIYGTTVNVDDGEWTFYASSVFKYQSPSGLQRLYAFGDRYSKGGTDPYGRVAIDDKGHVYGTVSQAYPSYGLVYKIVDGKEQIMHGFSGQDGVFPGASAIVLDASNNLYGTTFYGGAFDKGVVFKIAPDKVYTVLHSFGGDDGANPSYGVILDKDGNIYGNTYAGGAYDKGVIFKIAPSGLMTTLYSFKGMIGVHPNGPMIRDPAGNFYGTAQGGLHQKGTVYKVTPGGQAFALHSFGESAKDASYPSGRLSYDGSEYLYGTSPWGGKYGYGTLFRLSR